MPDILLIWNSIPKYKKKIAFIFLKLNVPNFLYSDNDEYSFFPTLFTLIRRTSISDSSSWWHFLVDKKWQNLPDEWQRAWREGRAICTGGRCLPGHPGKGRRTSLRSERPRPLAGGCLRFANPFFSRRRSCPTNEESWRKSWDTKVLSFVLGCVEWSHFILFQKHIFWQKNLEDFFFRWTDDRRRKQQTVDLQWTFFMCFTFLQITLNFIWRSMQHFRAGIQFKCVYLLSF